MQQHNLQIIGIKAQCIHSSLHTGNIAMMIGAPQVDDPSKATLKLIAMVSNICGKIGRNAIVTNNNTVLVVALGSGIEPQGTALLVNIATLLQKGYCLANFVGLMQGLFTEPHIEGYTKGFQILLQPGQLFFIGNIQEFSQALFFVQGHKFLAINANDALSSFNNIIAMVAIFREGNAGRHFVQLLDSQVRRHAPHFLQLQQLQITGIHRSGQIVHLVASIIDVIFAFHIIAGGTQQIHHGTAHSGTTSVTNMQRTGGISAHIFHLNATQIIGRQITIIIAGGQNAGQQISCPILLQIEVDEAGASDFCLFHGSTVQIIHHCLSYLTGCTVQAASRLHGKIGSKITKFLLGRYLQHYLGQSTRL